MIRRLLRDRPAAVAVGLTLAVFAVDLSLPLGVASAVPYTFAVLVALAARPGWVGPAVGVVCMVLTVAKIGLVPERGTTEWWKVIANRCLALFAVGMTTFLGLRRRRAEERWRADQADLAHVGRLLMLGQVATALAHELNQPLAAVALRAEVAARLAEPGPELTDALTEIAAQAHRAAEIVRGVRRMARRGDPGRDSLDLDDLARAVVRLTEWQARRAGVTVRVHPPARPLPRVWGDRLQLEQVVFNLVQNAVEALAVGPESPRQIDLSTTTGGREVRVSVADTGPGLADPDKVFDRFETTKADGLGLGLAIVRGIVEAHDGRVWAAANPGGGAVFHVALPVAAGGPT